MLRIATTSVMLLLASSVNAQNPPSQEPYWTPDAAMIAKLEAGLRIISLPKQTSYQLTQYDRYYAGVTNNGRRQIIGKWILPPNREDNPKTGIHITDMKYMPKLRGGGCANLRVTYYVDQDVSIGQCELTDASVPPSQLPHWKPDEQLAARMETAIEEFLHRTHGGLPELTQYSRYYWGVTIDGNQTILGRVLRLPNPQPGMHLASDWDDGPIMADGGCSNIQIAYDVKLAKLSRCVCDAELQMPLEKVQ